MQFHLIVARDRDVMIWLSVVCFAYAVWLKDKDCFTFPVAKSDYLCMLTSIPASRGFCVRVFPGSIKILLIVRSATTNKTRPKNTRKSWRNFGAASLCVDLNLKITFPKYFIFFPCRWGEQWHWDFQTGMVAMLREKSSSWCTTDTNHESASPEAL